MKVVETALPGVLLIEPAVYSDRRGWFTEWWNAERHAGEAGLPRRFVQDNLAESGAGVLRGLHYQWPDPQGKLVGVLHGAVFDVAVDIRPDSPSFRRWIGVELSAENHRQLWIPEGFAHGYAVMTADALLVYKCTAAYTPDHDRAIRWDDPTIAIDWPLVAPVLSEKDAAAPLLQDVPAYLLPGPAGREQDR